MHPGNVDGRPAEGGVVALPLDGERERAHLFVQLFLGQVGRERDVLIAAHAVGELGAKLLFQLVRHLAQHDVAGLMALGVVQLVQAVDVHVNAAERAEAAAGNVVLLAFKGVSVAQTGGLVVFRDEAQLCPGNKVQHHHAHDVGRGDHGDAAVHDAVEQIDGNDVKLLVPQHKQHEEHIPDDDMADIFDRRHDKQHGQREQKGDERGRLSAGAGHGADIDAERIQRGQKDGDADLQADPAPLADVQLDRQQKAENAERDEIRREIGAEYVADKGAAGGDKEKYDSKSKKNRKPAAIIVMHFLLTLHEFVRIGSGVKKQSLDFFHGERPFEKVRLLRGDKID